MRVSDPNPTDGLSMPILCVNVEDRQRAVEHVQRDIATLKSKQDAIVAKIAATDPDDTELLEKLQRDLASVHARITPLDDSMRARLSHIYRPDADSA